MTPKTVFKTNSFNIPCDLSMCIYLLPQKKKTFIARVDFIHTDNPNLATIICLFLCVYKCVFSICTCSYCFPRCLKLGAPINLQKKIYARLYA